MMIMTVYRLVITKALHPCSLHQECTSMAAIIILSIFTTSFFMNEKLVLLIMKVQIYPTEISDTSTSPNLKKVIRRHTKEFSQVALLLLNKP